MRDSERDDIKKLRSELKSIRDTELRGVIAGINKIADLIKKGFKTMASRTVELNASIDKLATIVTEGLAEIEKQMAVIGDPGTSEADADAAIARVNGVVTNLQAGVDRLKSDNPPTP